MIASPAGDILLSTHALEAQPDAALSEAMRNAAAAGQVVMTDFHAADGGNVIDVVAPVPGPDGQAFSLLIVRSDPNRSLYPLLQTWPVASRTSETVLVRRDGDAVLFLSNPPGRRDVALNLRVPVTRTTVPAVRAALGTVGRWDGVNEDGSEVVSDLRTIPDSPWSMVAEIDRSEALSLAAARDRAIAAFVLLTIGAHRYGAVRVRPPAAAQRVPSAGPGAAEARSRHPPLRVRAEVRRGHGAARRQRGHDHRREWTGERILRVQRGGAPGAEHVGPESPRSGRRGQCAVARGDGAESRRLRNHSPPAGQNNVSRRVQHEAHHRRGPPVPPRDHP